MDDTEIAAATSDQVKAWYGNYKALKFGDPLPEKEPTNDQIAALHTRVVTLGLEPYADFSLLTPFGRRMARTLRHRSFVQQQDGTFKPVEVPGPECMATWLKCWEVFEVILLMLRWPLPNGATEEFRGFSADPSRFIVTPVALEAYLQNFSTIVHENPGCWHLCQRAEDRCRA